MNCVEVLAACRRLKSRSRRKGCDGKAQRTTETPELHRWTRGQVEGADQAPAASDAERAENQSVYYTVAATARLFGHRFVLRLHSACRRSAPGCHHTTLHCRYYGQWS